MLNRWLTFGLSSEQEDRYRKAFFEADLRRARICILLILLATIVFVINDCIFLGLSSLFYAIVGCRLVLIATGLVLVRRTHTATSYRSYDNVEFAWEILLVGLMLAAAATRPQTYMVHAILAVGAVLTMLLILQNRFGRQLALSLALVVGEVGILARDLRVSPEIVIAIIFNLFASIVIGVAGARHLHGHRRLEFLAREREQHSHAAAERELAERQRAEQALRQSEERLRRAQQIAGVGSWEWDIGTGALLWSEQTYRQMGEPPEFKPSRDAFEQRLHIEDGKTFVTAIEKTLEGGGPFDLEFRIVRPNGEIRILHSRGEVVFGPDGRPIRMLGVSIDITEQKRVEEELRDSRENLALALRSSGMKVWRLDLGQQQRRFDDKVVGHPGIDSLPFGDTAEEFNTSVHPHDRNVLQAALCKAIATGICEVEYRTVWPDGTIHFVAARGQLARDKAGRPQYIYGLVWDITERKQAEIALQEVNANLERKVEERTKELARRADQLRALAGELTLSEQRERRRLAKFLHDQLQQLLVGAKFRLNILGTHFDPAVLQATKEVEQVLDELILESRSLTSELSPPILHEGGLKAGLEWLARWMASKHGLAVDLSTEGDFTPPLAEPVRILLFEAVRELLFNSVKHANTGSASVNLYRLEGGQLCITVSDNGSGFDPGKLKQVGEGGGGFGLFSIRERLNLIGGKLEIESSPGEGSRFMLTAPVLQMSTSELSTVPLATQDAGDRQVVPMMSSTPARPIRILLADDHAVVREGLTRLLSSEPDMEILGEAANGQEAIEKASKLLPDVILMDISMPKLNGIEATGVIKKVHPEIRIIGLSMFEEGEFTQAMLDAGAVSYLTKSGASTDLIKAIRHCMAAREAPMMQS